MGRRRSNIGRKSRAAQKRKEKYKIAKAQKYNSNDIYRKNEVEMAEDSNEIQVMTESKPSHGLYGDSRGNRWILYSFISFC